MASAGYTLIEVIIVLLLLSILATIAWPALEVSLGRFLLEEAAQQLAREIRQTQQRAVVREESFWLTFILKSQYCLIVDSSGKRVTFTLPTGVKIEHTTFPNNEVTFHPSGAPSRGGTITLINERGEKMYVMVTVGAGRVRVAKEL
ncbi:MAG: prepilin-type N-terminal cleavage/methylation domain-containing protein [Firmicutes bacterium]|nr:prepilin-type N-terminal cleavage/methylation domain-containing protein [Bacillota bacterium]